MGESGKIGQSQAFKNKWIGLKGENVVRLVDSVQDKTREELLSISETFGKGLNENSMKELKKRKLIDRQKKPWYSVCKGPCFSVNLEKLSTDLTVEMIQSGSWRSSKFKK